MQQLIVATATLRISVQAMSLLPTAIHAQVERCRAGQCASLVERLASGWLIFGEQQVLAGYCLLLPDPVVPDLNALQGAARAGFLNDMSLAGDALLAATAAIRINYAIFGNVEPALHAHLFPRLPTEPDAVRSLEPFALDWNAAPRFSEARHGDLRRRVAEELRCRAG
jgi:diadenosine tetraphosphate (Ap4A) HIT family hydrolase